MITQSSLEAFHSALEDDCQDVQDFVNENYEEILELFETGSVTVNNGAVLLELIVTKVDSEVSDELE